MSRRGLAAGLALLLSLSGCAGKGEYLPYAREMEDMVLIRAVGLDLADGAVTVTAASAAQSGGEEPPQVLSCRGETVSGAVLELQTYGDSYVFFGHVGELVLGEEMARRGLREAMDYIQRDMEMRLDTGLFVMRGAPAGEAMKAATGEDSSAARRLEALEDDTGLSPAAAARSVRSVLCDLAANGASYAPALGLAEGEEEAGGELTAVGYAIFKGMALAGWAEGDAARGIDLVTGRVEADVLPLPGEPGSRSALRVVRADSRVRPVFSAGQLTGVEITCAVEANIAQAPLGLTQWDPAALERARTALEETELARLQAAVALSQALGADFLGLKKRCGLAQPWNWAGVKEQWDRAFPRLELRLRVEGTLQRGYDLR